MKNGFEDSVAPVAYGADFAGRVAVARVNMDQVLETHPKPDVRSVAAHAGKVIFREIVFAGAWLNAEIHGVDLSQVG
ncbi:MAG: hypothetical protein JWO47_694 [Candidatus Saccharibacteria bacterium]|nr:hypothetical protein [Candidatus Saccharibacteria bacterium]